MGLKTRIHRPQIMNGAKQQAAARQQDKRESNLHHHQKTLRSMVAAHQTAASLPERDLQAGLRTLPRGHKTEDDPDG